ncbi:MAG: hypothetical protein AAF447_15735, partial [Myxococcota bacterium]
MDAYESVLELSPTHVKAQQALERLIGEASQRQRVAAILEPLYDAQGAWADLARVLEVELEDVGTPGEQLERLTRLAALHEHKLNDDASAFRALSRAVIAEPAELEVRRELARVARARRVPEERADVLEQARVAVEGQGRVEAEILAEIGQLYDGELGDADSAEPTWRKLVDVAGDDPELVLPAARALERLHLESGAYGKLADALRLQVRLTGDDDERATLLRRLATLFEETLEDTDQAVATHRERLDLNPDDTEAMVALERLYARQGEWQRLIGVLQMRDPLMEDAAEQATLARRVGEVYERQLADADSAIVAYNDVLARFGHDAESLRALARLYEAGGKWDDLLEVVEMRLEAAESVEARVEQRFRAAELLRTRIGDPERAIEAYRAALDEVPGHAPTVTALEEILGDPEAALRVEAARTLVPVFEGAARYDALANALEVVAETEDPYDRLAALERAAEVAEMGLEDPRRAFDLTGRAVRAALEEPRLDSLLADLARHAEAADAWGGYVALLQEIAPQILDGDLQTEALMRVGAVARDRIADRNVARESFERVLGQRPEHRGALDALEALHAEAEAVEPLLEVLSRKTEIAETPEERVDLLARQAALREEAMKDVPAAIDCWERLLIEDETHEGAYEALERLYEADARWPELSELLARRLDAGVGSGVATRQRLAQVQIERLDDAYAGLEHLREALDRDADHEPSIALLETLMEDREHRSAAAAILEPVFLRRMDWPRVTGTLDARLDATDDPTERKELLGRLAAIYEDHLEDLEGALGVYARLFREDIRDRRSWEMLGRLAKVLDQQKRVAGIYAQAVEREGVVDEPTAELARLAARNLGDGEATRALGLWERVIEFEPMDRGAYESSAQLLKGLGSWDALLALYRHRVDVSDDEVERSAILHAAAQVMERELDNPEGAIEAYQEALETDPEDALASETLDRLLTQRARWPELADHLRFRIDGALGTPAEPELKHRLGTLLSSELDDKHGAVDVFEDIVASHGPHGPTLTALERVVLDGDLQRRVTEILEPLYRSQDQWKKLIAVLEARAKREDDPVDKAALLAEVGALFETRGDDRAASLGAWSRAFAVHPEGGAQSEVERLATDLEAWDELVGSYEQALAASDDPAGWLTAA